MYHFSMRQSVLMSTLAFSFLFHAHGETEHAHKLDDFIVSAGPLARPVDEFSNPFTSLDGDELQREAAATLGEVLDGQPGVTASSFGAGASRPIIRGFDGPRVRILDSGIDSFDVSETSPDHAVSVEPLLTDRIEVLRGPSTLLYGGSAIGGVVNVVGKEIPRAPLDASGFEGSLEARYDTVSEGETYLGYATAGGENWAFRVTGLTREAEDYEIPGDAETGHDEEEEEDEEHSSGELENSFVETDAWSAGGTWFFGEQNYIGASFSVYESLYGVPGHAHEGESVSIDLERQRFDIEAAIFEPVAWIEAARIRFGYTDYEHTELEGDEDGTLFDREGWELRAEAAHSELPIFSHGLWGLQISENDFDAIGEEAFSPASTTTNYAVFASEHWHSGQWHFELGGRLEYQEVDAETENGDYDDIATSLALGLIYDRDEKQSIALSLQRSQRHPTSTELFADGPHLATSQFEIGNPDLDLETAYGVDLSYRFNTEDWAVTVTAFGTYFEDYVFAAGTGAVEDDLPVFEYTSVDAVFWGLEFEMDHVIYSSDQNRFTVGLIGDYVRAENIDDDEDLPRIPPLRLGARARFESGPWQGGVFLRHAFEQSDTAPNETDTDGYTELTVDIARSFELTDRVSMTAFARASNLLDEEIRHHTSFLKDVAPMPGRNLTIGARFTF